jgi:hypothetical protein
MVGTARRVGAPAAGFVPRLLAAEPHDQRRSWLAAEPRQVARRHERQRGHLASRGRRGKLDLCRPRRRAPRAGYCLGRCVLFTRRQLPADAELPGLRAGDSLSGGGVRGRRRRDLPAVWHGGQAGLAAAEKAGRFRSRVRHRLDERAPLGRERRRGTPARADLPPGGGGVSAWIPCCSMPRKIALSKSISGTPIRS